jgi:hypothetical protein
MPLILSYDNYIQDEDIFKGVNEDIIMSASSIADDSIEGK